MVIGVRRISEDQGQRTLDPADGCSRIGANDRSGIGEAAALQIAANAAAGVVAGIYECGPWGIGGASAGHFPYPDTGEELWCCYAWPLDDHVTGHRVFFVNQEGRFLQSKNDGSGLVYDGLFDTPEFDAAYSARPEFPNGLTGMGAPLGSAPRRANDGNRWNPLGR